jgi:ribosome-binding protein aMBF1 (putative translation factor)
MKKNEFDSIKCLYCGKKATTYILEKDAHIFLCEECYKKYKEGLL